MILKLFFSDTKSIKPFIGFSFLLESSGFTRSDQQKLPTVLANLSVDSFSLWKSLYVLLRTTMVMLPKALSCSIELVVRSVSK